MKTKKYRISTEMMKKKKIKLMEYIHVWNFRKLKYAHG